MDVNNGCESVDGEGSSQSKFTSSVEASTSGGHSRSISNNEVVQCKMSKAKLYFFTGLIFFCYTVYGIGYNIWGPTWIDLITLLHSSQEQLAYANSLMAIGYIFGSFTSAFVYDNFGRQIFIGLYLFLIGLSICLTPVLANYYLFLVMALLFGIGEGGFDTGINSWILEMWLDDNGPVMQSMYFFYGLGTFLSPLICLKFLSDDNFVDQTLHSNVSYPVQTNLMSNITRLGQLGPHHHAHFFPMLTRTYYSTGDSFQSNIEIPYFIIGGMLVLTSISLVLSHFFVRYHPDEAATILRLKEPYDTIMDDEKKCLTESTEHSKYGAIDSPINERIHEEGNESRRKIIILVLIGAVMCCFYDGMENISFEYMTSFLVNAPLTISEAEAAKLVSAMSGAYTVARGAGILIIMKVSPKFLLVIDFGLIFVGLNLLYYNMDSNETGLLAGLLMLGLGTATFMPCLYSYFEEHVRLTNSLCAILSLSCALVSTIDPIIVGHLISNLPAIVLYINYASLVIVAVAFTLFELVSMCK